MLLCFSALPAMNGKSTPEKKALYVLSLDWIGLSKPLI